MATGLWLVFINRLHFTILPLHYLPPHLFHEMDNHPTFDDFDFLTATSFELEHMNMNYSYRQSNRRELPQSGLSTATETSQDLQFIEDWVSDVDRIWVS